MSLSNTVENEMLTDFLTRHPTIYLAMSTADPGETGSGVAEPTGTYVRQLIDGIILSGNTLLSDNPITFPVASVSWGTITYAALYDAETIGVFLGSVAITPFDCVANTRVIVPAGTIVMSMD